MAFLFINFDATDLMDASSCSLCHRELTVRQLDNMAQLKKRVFQRYFRGNIDDDAADTRGRAISREQYIRMLSAQEVEYVLRQNICPHHRKSRPSYKHV